MVIYHRKRGIYALIALMLAFLAGLGIPALLHDHMANRFAGILGGTSCFVIGLWVWRIYREANMGNEEKHTLYFIPAQYWALPIWLFAVLVIAIFWNEAPPREPDADEGGRKTMEVQESSLQAGASPERR